MNFGGMMQNLPDGFPPTLAIPIMVSGLDEHETKLMLLETGDFSTSQIDRWVDELRSKGWFEADSDPLNALFGSMATLSTATKKEDGASYLWKCLFESLVDDESDFKHRIAALDTEAKTTNNDLHGLASYEAEASYPWNMVDGNFPWQGCKFVASTVMLLVSKTDNHSKKNAVRRLSKMLGGTRIPDNPILKQVRDPYILTKAISKALDESRRDTSCIALLVNTTDVEIMNNPGTRPGTFAHAFVVLVSRDGMYILQGYGPRGYTLLQHMQTHDQQYPLSGEKALEWALVFETYSAERSGKWTKQVNEAYSHCFGVDLVELGTMKIGSQLDAYTTVQWTEFDADIVEANIALLPKKRSPALPKRKCLDGKTAKADKAPAKYKPDGGVKHCYIPEVKRCGQCGKTEDETGKLHKRCTQCKAIHYCCRDHQLEDWSDHKATCKSIARK